MIRLTRPKVATAFLLLGWFTVNAAILWPTHKRELIVETVVGPDTGYRYKHAPSACELTGGDILLVYYGGSEEYGKDTAIYGTRWMRAKQAWTHPEKLIDDPEKPEGNPVIWQSPDSLLWLFYPVRHGSTWSTATLEVRVSKDLGKTWADSPSPSGSVGLMTRARPIVLSSGDYLLPVDHNPSTDTEFVSPDSCSLFLRYDVGRKAWSSTSKISSRLGNHQPSVVELVDGTLVAYCRRGGDYAGRDDGFLVRTQSSDGGKTWTYGTDSAFPNPNAPADVLKLANGHLALAYNDSAFNRSSLSVSISTDNDHSYPYKREVVFGTTVDYSYPWLLEGADGILHMFFSSARRSQIQHLVFEEDAILSTR